MQINQREEPRSTFSVLFFKEDAIVLSALEKTMWCLGEQRIVVKLTSCFDAILTLLSGNKRA